MKEIWGKYPKCIRCGKSCDGNDISCGHVSDFWPYQITCEECCEDERIDEHDDEQSNGEQS